jgi:hypothetical protein
MVMQTENSAQEVERYIKENAPEAKPEQKKEEAKAEKTEAKPEKTEEGDEIPEWVTRLGITPQQHEGITEVIKRAINRKHAQAREAEEFAAAQYNEKRLAEERAERAERERDEARKAAQPPKKEAEEPKREAFESDEAYRNALIDWRVDQKLKDREAEETKQREKERQDRIMSEASARIAKARELVPDFDEVVAGADDIIPSHIAAYMQESEMFAELGYHFAQHPEELRKLAELPSRTYSDLLRVGVALDKIQSKIQPFSSEKAYTNGTKPSSSNGASAESDTGTVPSQPRAAAPVIQPLNGSSASQVDKPASRMNYDETKADWQKRNGRDLSRRSRH